MKLDGLRVLDLSQFLPGPHLTMMMADHGASVIRVEARAGEPTRAIGLSQAGHTVFFRNTHRGKRSVKLNLKTEQGKQVLLRLAAESDVVVESFRPGVVKRLGVDYETIKDVRADIIYCSISAFGQTGPYRLKPAHDLNIQALTGALSVNLGWDGKPFNPGAATADMAASLIALSGILMALYRRTVTGEGDYLDIAMHDSMLAWSPHMLGPVIAEKRAPTAKHERHWGGASFYHVYETADHRYLTLGGRELHFVRTLLEALEQPDLIALCEHEPGPIEDPVREFLSETFAEKTLAEWVEWFEGKNVCFAPVKNLREALDDPQVRAREMVLVEGDGIEHLGVPIKFLDEPGRVEFELPGPGEHTEEVLRELGYGDRELDEFWKEGVI